MPDWIAEHRDSIAFVAYLSTGLVLVLVGLVADDAAVVALGAGAMGLPGFRNAADES